MTTHFSPPLPARLPGAVYALTTPRRPLLSSTTCSATTSWVLAAGPHLLGTLSLQTGTPWTQARRHGDRHWATSFLLPLGPRNPQPQPLPPPYSGFGPLVLSSPRTSIPFSPGFRTSSPQLPLCFPRGSDPQLLSPTNGPPRHPGVPAPGPPLGGIHKTKFQPFLPRGPKNPSTTLVSQATVSF